MLRRTKHACVVRPQGQRWQNRRCRYPPTGVSTTAGAIVVWMRLQPSNSVAKHVDSGDRKKKKKPAACTAAGSSHTQATMLRPLTAPFSISPFILTEKFTPACDATELSVIAVLGIFCQLKNLCLECNCAGGRTFERCVQREFKCLTSFSIRKY